MFTGIVEIIGTVSEIKLLDASVSDGGKSMLITDAAEILSDCHLGDSISINGTFPIHLKGMRLINDKGTCLTVTTLPSSSSFTVGIAPETLRRTTLGSLTENSHVNLERAMLPSTRMGGHLVQGHVDTIATIIKLAPDGEALTLRFEPREKEHMRYIVEKGFVAIDGASLTVTAVSDEGKGWWEVMLIEYTQSRIVTSKKKVGDTVNVEVDMVGKYVEKSVAAWFSEEGGKASSAFGSVVQKIVEQVVDEKLKARRIS